MNRNKNEKGHPKLTVFNFSSAPDPDYLSLSANFSTPGSGNLELVLSKLEVGPPA